MTTNLSEFNQELRDWVHRQTGDRIAVVLMSVLGVSRATAYRRVEGDELVSLAELLTLVIKCTPPNLTAQDRPGWTQRWTKHWHERWQTETERLQRLAVAPQEPGPEGSPSPPDDATPWSHRDTSIDLPRALVAPLLRDDRPEPTPFVEVLDAWNSEGRSNLLFVSGPSGCAKTTETKRWLASEPMVNYTSLLDGPLQPELARMAKPSGQVVVIDDFDPILSRSGEDSARPDLSLLRPFFAAGGRAIVLCKRNPMIEADELADQLRNPTRLEGLGIVSPRLVRVLPVSAESLRVLATATSDRRLSRLARFLEQSSDLELANPIVLRQLYDVLDEPAVIPKTRWEAYSIYVNHVCGLAWDRGTSLIPGRVRFLTYRDLAWDIFRGVDQSVARRRLAVSVSRVAERLQENIQRDITLTRQRDYLTHEWTADLLGVTDLFGSTPRRPTDDTSFARFSHSSYYEFFVAEAICASLSNERPLQLDQTQFAEATMDSLVVGFLKASLEADDYEAIRTLCLRTTLSWQDRLLCLYLMEEQVDFGQLLNAAPEDYWESLSRGQDVFESLFLRKATMFQLVIMGRVPAENYVAVLRAEERPQDEAQERHLLGSSSDLTASLMNRLLNPELRRAMPISLFRIGQMGHPRCIPQLEELVVTEPTLRDDIANTIEKIQERHA